MTPRHRSFAALFGLLLVFAGLLAVVSEVRHVASLDAAYNAPERPEYRWGTPTAVEAEHEGYLRGHTGHHTEWVLEYLTPESFANKATRSDAFKADEDVPAEWRATLADYKHHPKYDRGHIAPAADMHWSPDAMASCFLLSNTMPQTKKLNELHTAWEGLEVHIREIASSDGAKVWVITGPAWLPDADGKICFEVIGPHAVWVPTHCFKAVYAEVADKRWMEGYLLANVADPPRWQDCQVRVDDLEADVGLDFFAGIDDDTENVLEAARPN